MRDGLHRQYFERTILEHHSDNPQPYDVLPVRIGALLSLDAQLEHPEPFRRRGEERSPVSDAVYFPETGHAVSGLFRSYWETHGGLVTFGFPLSEPFEEIDASTGQPRLVQYFERARMEHHPDNPPAYQVLLRPPRTAKAQRSPRSAAGDHRRRSYLTKTAMRRSSGHRRSTRKTVWVAASTWPTGRTPTRTR